MRVVWKFDVPSKPQRFTLELPVGTELFGLDFQAGKLYTWGLVNTEAELTVRHLVVTGTGHELPPVDGNFRFVGMKQVEGFDEMGAVYRVVQLFEILPR